MSKFLRASAVLASIVMAASVGQAQTVAMAGEYSEGNGIVVNIPQNPPSLPCATGQAGWDAQNNARCLRNNQKFFGGGAGPVFANPHHGVVGARLIGPGGAGGSAGLNVGDPFSIPPLAFQQRLGYQVGIVLNNITVQLDTFFTAGAPGTARSKNPPANTRQFGPLNLGAAPQDNGLTGGALAQRALVETDVLVTIGAETLNFHYNNPGNPTGFGGTMTILLDGGGRLYLAGPQINGLFPASLHPIVGTNPVGDTVAGFNVRNAAGWDYTVTGSQMAGQFKAFVGAPSAVAGACAITPPPSPAGCNEINGFDTKGFFVAPLPGATSTKHMFAWTTGTVSMVRTAVRNMVTMTDTVTGRGYDTVGVTPTNGTQVQRNVGMVAGSYTFRTDGIPTTQMNLQMAGIDLKFTPEPGATVALISGLGMLGALAARRRS
jgi:hypothetical protein